MAVTLTDVQARNILKAIEQCITAYEDETREDWSDVDQSCREICYEVSDIIRGQLASNDGTEPIDADK